MRTYVNIRMYIQYLRVYTYACLFQFSQMVTIDVYQHRFHWIYEKKEGLNHILDRDDIFV